MPRSTLTTDYLYGWISDYLSFNHGRLSLDGGRGPQVTISITRHIQEVNPRHAEWLGTCGPWTENLLYLHAIGHIPDYLLTYHIMTNSWQVLSHTHPKIYLWESRCLLSLSWDGWCIGYSCSLLWLFKAISCKGLNI